MSNKEFKNRVYGCTVVKAINANYNADFSGLPRRLKSDGTFYATDKSFKWLVRNYIKKNTEETVLFTKQLNEKLESISLSDAYGKLEEKENVLSTLLECIDVRVFGATFAEKGHNLSLHGVVQVNHATDLYGKGKIYTDEILAPFTAIGSMSKATEAHYIHNFSVNPKNLSSWKDLIGEKKDKKEKTTLKLLSEEDMIILKNAFNNAATFYDSHSKSGIENELSIYVTLTEDSILTLPSFSQFIKFEKGLDGNNNSFDISKLISYLEKYDNDIECIEIYYIEELTDVVYASQSEKIKKGDLVQLSIKLEEQENETK